MRFGSHRGGSSRDRRVFTRDDGISGWESSVSWREAAAHHGVHAITAIRFTPHRRRPSWARGAEPGSSAAARGRSGTLATNLYRLRTMKLIDALALVKTGSAGADAPLPVLLACGFEPLHLGTFLTAHLQQRFPQRPVRLTTGLYG